MSQPYNLDSTSQSCQPSNTLDMYAPKSTLDSESDLKGSASNYEALFDSGYNSNVQSKTFLDESDLEPVQSKLQSKHLEDIEKRSSQKGASIQQWSDSGVCITDSGLSINDEYNNEPQSESEIKPPSVESDLPRTWLKQNSEGDTLLHLAIIEDLEDIACSIIRNISSPNELLNSYNYLYQTPLHLAVLKRQLNVVQLLVSKEVSLTFQDNLGNTPLHIACKYSLTDFMRFFLTCPHKSLLPSMCFELRNYDGDTCIHLAAYNNNLKLLELLLRSGANFDVQEGKSGKTILHWAVENLNVQLVYFLLNKCNSSLDIRTFSDQTPLHLAWKMHLSLKNEASSVLKSKASKILKMLQDKCGDLKLSMETLYTDSESDFSSDEEDE